MTATPTLLPTRRGLRAARPGMLALCAMLCAAAAVAQTPIFETRDKDGPVFSDKPSPGATPFNPGPVNVVPSTPTAPPADPSPQPAAPPYRSLMFSAPANQGTVHSNTGAFEIVLRPSPGLRSSAGDRIQLMLDGTVLPTLYRSNRVQLTEADWQAAAAGNTVQHTLQAAIVDANGRVLITSTPVVFYVQRAAVGGARRAR